jgi:hypothetical protein
VDELADVEVLADLATLEKGRTVAGDVGLLDAGEGIEQVTQRLARLESDEDRSFEQDFQGGTSLRPT